MCDDKFADVHELSVNATATTDISDQNLIFMEAMERNKIVDVLRETRGNKLETARRLGIGRQTSTTRSKPTPSRRSNPRISRTV